MTDQVILEVKEISKSFGGNHALSKVSFQLKKGEILSVMARTAPENQH